MGRFRRSRSQQPAGLTLLSIVFCVLAFIFLIGAGVIFEQEASTPGQEGISNVFVLLWFGIFILLTLGAALGLRLRKPWGWHFAAIFGFYWIIRTIDSFFYMPLAAEHLEVTGRLPARSIDNPRALLMLNGLMLLYLYWPKTMQQLGVKGKRWQLTIGVLIAAALIMAMDQLMTGGEEI